MIDKYLIGKWKTTHHSYKSYVNKTVNYYCTWIINEDLRMKVEDTEGNKYRSKYMNFDDVESIRFNVDQMTRNGDIFLNGEKNYFLYRLLHSKSEEYQQTGES